MEIIKPGDKSEQRFSGLYQGGAFSGKTHCICSWPNVALISFDPDKATARKMGVNILQPSSWGEFTSEILPHVMNHTMHQLVDGPVDTVGLDSISIAASKLESEIQGRSSKMAIQDWGTFKTKLNEAALIMTDATRPRDGHPGYHILFSTHLRAVTRDEGMLEAWRPDISGRFAELLPRLFSFSFLCESTTETIREPNQPGVQRQVYRVHTVPPDKAYLCGDRVGGGKNKTLPPITSGLYPDLMAAWGLDP